MIVHPGLTTRFTNFHASCSSSSLHVYCHDCYRRQIRERRKLRLHSLCKNGRIVIDLCFLMDGDDDVVI